LVDLFELGTGTHVRKVASMAAKEMQVSHDGRCITLAGEGEMRVYRVE
jgi:hypothetical protein